MPKKETKEPAGEQGKRFIADAQRMIDAGELNPTDAEKNMENIVRRLSAATDPKP